MIPYEPHKIILQVSENLALFSWAFFKFAGLIIGIYYLYRESRRRKDINLNSMMLLGLVAGLGVLIGGRIFHFIGPWHSMQMPFWESARAIFSPTGGWVSYGGMIFAILFGYAYLRFMKLDRERYADIASIAVVLGYFIGRFGCFFAGMIASKGSSLPWAILYNGTPVHPVPIYHALANLAVFAILLMMLRRQDMMNSGRKQKEHGHVFAYSMMLYSLFRFFIEFFRIYPENNYVLGLTMSQVISIFFFAAGAVYLSSKKDKLFRAAGMAGPDAGDPILLMLGGGLLATLSVLLINMRFYLLSAATIAGVALLLIGIRKHTEIQSK